MLVRIDKSSDEPIYRQIRGQIIEAIASGKLEVGQQLPSVRKLAAEIDINFHTVNKAYAVLRDEGYLVMKGRAGATVAKPAGSGSKAKRQRQDALEEGLKQAALAHKAKGGTSDEFAGVASLVLVDVFGASDAAIDAKGGSVSAASAGLDVDSGEEAVASPADSKPDLPASSKPIAKKRASGKKRASSRVAEAAQDAVADSGETGVVDGSSASSGAAALEGDGGGSLASRGPASIETPAQQDSASNETAASPAPDESKATKPAKQKQTRARKAKKPKPSDAFDQLSLF